MRSIGTREIVRVTDWRAIKCVRCGGSVYLDDTQFITRRIERSNWRLTQAD